MTLVVQAEVLPTLKPAHLYHFHLLQQLQHWREQLFQLMLAHRQMAILMTMIKDFTGLHKAPSTPIFMMPALLHLALLFSLIEELKCIIIQLNRMP